MRRLEWTAVLCLALGGACASSVHDYRGPRMNRSLFEEPRRELPARVVVFPAHAFLARINENAGKDGAPADLASVFVADPEASERARVVLERVAASELERGAPFELVPLPELGAEERANVDEHVALFYDVGWTASNCASFWKTPDFKLREFDYSLGPGLAALKERTGADAGLFIGAAGVELVGGLVDLASGDLLWVNAVEPGEGHDWTNEDAVRALFRRLWKPYPGLEAFARLRSQT